MFVEYTERIFVLNLIQLLAGIHRHLLYTLILLVHESRTLIPDIHKYIQRIKWHIISCICVHPKT